MMPAHSALDSVDLPRRFKYFQVNLHDIQAARRECHGRRR